MIALESELLNSIDIFPDDKGKLVVVPACVSVRDVGKLEAFTCHVYAPKASTTKVNELRYHLFLCQKKIKWKVTNSHHARTA